MDSVSSLESIHQEIEELIGSEEPKDLTSRLLRHPVDS